MRFRAFFRKETVQSFLGVLLALSRFSKSGKQTANPQSFIKLTRPKVYLSVRNSDLVEAYAEFDTKDIFHDGFILESKRENMIGLTVQMSNFFDALRCGVQCEKISVKLSKRDSQAMLSFEFTDPLLDNISITQVCPVQQLLGESFDEAATPEIPVCEWNVELPPVKRLLNILSQMKKIGSDRISIELTRMDEKLNPSSFCGLCISTDSDLVLVNTQYRKCSLFLQQVAPKELKVERKFSTIRMKAVLQAASDALSYRSGSGFAILAIPEDLEVNPWACIVVSLNAVESCRVFYVVPAYTEPS